MKKLLPKWCSLDVWARPRSRTHNGKTMINNDSKISLSFSLRFCFYYFSSSSLIFFIHLLFLPCASATWCDSVSEASDIVCVSYIIYVHMIVCCSSQRTLIQCHKSLTYSQFVSFLLCKFFVCTIRPVWIQSFCVFRCVYTRNFCFYSCSVRKRHMFDKLLRLIQWNSRWSHEELLALESIIVELWLNSDSVRGRAHR